MNTFLKEISLRDAEVELSNRVYQAALFLELLEGAGKVYGNGHHGAQAVAAFTVEELRRRMAPIHPPGSKEHSLRTLRMLSNWR